MKNLTDLGENVRHQLESEEKEGKPASTKAEEWLKEVEELEKRVNVLWESHLVAKNKESCGCFSNCKERCKLGREVAELLEEVKRLQKSGSSKKLFQKAEFLTQKFSANMDVVASIVCPVIAEFVPFDIKNTIKLESNLGDLDREMKNLMDLREDIQHQLVSAAVEKEEQSETSIAEEWLREVEDLERKANTTRENVMARSETTVLGWFSYWKWRCRLSRKVVRMFEEIERLQSTGNSGIFFQTS